MSAALRALLALTLRSKNYHLHLLQRRDDLGLEQYAAGLDDGGRPRRTTLIVS